MVEVIISFIAVLVLLVRRSTACPKFVVFSCLCMYNSYHEMSVVNKWQTTSPNNNQRNIIWPKISDSSERKLTSFAWWGSLYDSFTALLAVTISDFYHIIAMINVIQNNNKNILMIWFIKICQNCPVCCLCLTMEDTSYMSVIYECREMVWSLKCTEAYKTLQ